MLPAAIEVVFVVLAEDVDGPVHDLLILGGEARVATVAWPLCQKALACPGAHMGHRLNCQDFTAGLMFAVDPTRSLRPVSKGGQEAVLSQAFRALISFPEESL